MRKNQIVLVSILATVILVGAVFGVYYWFQYVRPEVEVSTKEEGIDLCAEFPKVEGEVTCQEAIQLALEKYPGIITSIRRTQAEYIDTQGIWLLKLILKEPVRANGVEYDIEVSVNRDNKEIFIYRFIERQK